MTTSKLNRKSIKVFEKIYTLSTAASFKSVYVDIQADLKKIVGTNQSRIVGMSAYTTSGGIIPYVYFSYNATDSIDNISYLYGYNCTSASITSPAVKLKVAYTES